MKLNALIIGNGHYATGMTSLGEHLRSDKNQGVFLPGLLALRHEGLVGEIVLCATDGDRLAESKQRAESLAAAFGWDPALRILPERGRRDSEAYLAAIDGIERPAVALIAVPDHLHAGVMQACIRAGLPFLVVKPAVTGLAEFEATERLLTEHDGFGMVDFHKVYDDANLMLRQVVRSGELGALQHVYSQQTQRRLMLEIYSRWLERDERMNVNHYLGCHYIHLTHFLTAAEPLDVRALPHYGLAREKFGRPVADLITTQVRWRERDGGVFTSYHVAGWADPDTTSSMTFQEIEVIGSAGRVRSDQRDRGYRKITQNGGVDVPNPYFFQLAEGLAGSPDLGGQYGLRSLRVFVRAARDVLCGETNPRRLDEQLPTFRQSAVTTSILDAADRSLERDGAVVPIDRVRPAG